MPPLETGYDCVNPTHKTGLAPSWSLHRYIIRGCNMVLYNVESIQFDGASLIVTLCDNHGDSTSIFIADKFPVTVTTNEAGDMIVIVEQ